MKYRVVLQRFAQQDLDEACLWAAKRAPETAAKWLDRFHHALQSLAVHPDRCPLAAESRKAPFELREYLFGKRPYVFRVVFTIDSKTVRILRILRAQRRNLTRRQIDEAAEE